ncbi:MAG: lipopolysaccharide assembly protein LapB [Ktedonobacterales bacterium]|nr:lipopolysaccharide assembly protein LapB [Ktedonobacterales bacterium]
MLEALWLLLPVAAASGWWAAGRAAAARHARKKSVLSSDYFKGLNYLVNEQPDKAIEVFIRMVEVDSETIETHLALGSLFRRRGEVDRAIRIHQNLIARPSLDRDQRTQALLELGQDYMNAGLLDRAESLFLELVELNAHTVRALQLLGDIYEQEKEWLKAVDIARRLESRTDRRFNHIIAQCYCELAVQARHGGDTSGTEQWLTKALSSDWRCARAGLLRGEMRLEAGDYPGAIEAYQQVEQQDPDYLPEALEPMLRCYRELGKVKEMIRYLNEIIQRHGGITALLLLSRLIERQEDRSAAASLLLERLRTHPSLRGLRQLTEVLDANGRGVTPDELGQIKGIIDVSLKDEPLYICSKCGFSGKVMHWKCPSCKHWNSVKPIQGLEWI